MCSQKGLWVKVWISNSNPNLIGRFYLDYLFKTRRIASKLRLDKGTETSGVATMQAYLPQQHSVMEVFHMMDMAIDFKPGESSTCITKLRLT